MKVTCQQDKITFGEMRASGVRDVLIIAATIVARTMSKSTPIGRPDNVRLSDVDPSFTCTACGKRGADIRPNFPQARMGLPEVGLHRLQEAPHRFAGAACWHRYWGRIAVEDHFDLLLRVSDHGHQPDRPNERVAERTRRSGHLSRTARYTGNFASVDDQAIRCGHLVRYVDLCGHWLSSQGKAQGSGTRTALDARRLKVRTIRLSPHFALGCVNFLKSVAI